VIDALRIERAAAAIDPVFTHTPQYASEPLAERLGCAVVLKVETINPIRSFKGRGTDWLVQGAAAGETLACASAGNFGQGLAYAGRRRGHPVHVHTAATANPRKVARMRALGATVEAVDGDFDAAKAQAVAEAERHGRRLVVDGRDPEIAEGAGTLAVELLAGGAQFDAILVPVGNGALISGVAAWVKAVAPDTEVIAVGPAGAPVMERAWRTGELGAAGPTDTIADGLAARVPEAEAVAAMRATVDRYVLVDDDRLREAVALLRETDGLLVEPSGAAGVAGAIELAAELRGASTAVPICGSNA
jgi:threonine dehydratase